MPGLMSWGLETDSKVVEVDSCGLLAMRALVDRVMLATPVVRILTVAGQSLPTTSNKRPLLLPLLTYCKQMMHFRVLEALYNTLVASCLTG